MPKTDPTLIPGCEHYSADYIGDGRIFSYAHQVQVALRHKPGAVLEVGVGPGIVSAILRAADVRVVTLDVQHELGASVIASVLNTPFKDGSFDVALCCQVLEHLPFENFTPALRELNRVTRKGLVLSLPDVTRFNYLSLKLPRLGSLFWNIPFPWMSRLPDVEARLREMGHYWEIGYKDFKLARVVDGIEKADWRVAATWRVVERPWHRFFHLLPVKMT